MTRPSDRLVQDLFLSMESIQNVESGTENVESKILFLLQEIRKIIKIVATMSDFKTKMLQNLFSAGAPPQTPLGERTALP